MLSLSHPRLDLPLVFRPHGCPGLCQGIKEESGSEEETIWRQEVIQRVLSDDPEMKGLGGGKPGVLGVDTQRALSPSRAQSVFQGGRETRNES